MHDPEALLRADAESAAGAVLLLPWGGEEASALHCNAADAAMVDAYVLAAARHLRSLNPHMQVRAKALCSVLVCRISYSCRPMFYIVFAVTSSSRGLSKPAEQVFTSACWDTCCCTLLGAEAHSRHRQPLADWLALFMQVLCELSQYSSLVYLDPLGSLLDWHCGEAAAAAATPAFMSGAVLLPQMLDSMTCQVRRQALAALFAYDS
jgi:hypothetical protein